METVMPEINNNNQVQLPRLRESLAKARPEMAVLAPRDLLQIQVDPMAAVTTARGALPQIMAFKLRMAKLPEFEIKNLENLELYALATTQAQAVFLGASAPPERFQELVAEATELREQLLSDATALARRGLINGAKLAELKGSVGYRNVASDLLTLTNMIRADWAKVVGKTGVTEAELDRAEVVGDQLINDIGLKQLAPAAVAAVALERQQAYTLLVNAYDQVRRAISYLRWDEDDVDSIAPSLYAGRKRKTSTDVDPTPAVEPVAAKAAPAATAEGGTATKPAVGLPGADPFIH
jgi:hypothetical protein